MIFWCVLGTLAGIIAGLIPGLHSNNIALILAFTPFFGMEITAFMLSMCITQSFVEFIPSTFLGAPSENTFESVLPAHKLLLEGKALEAINHTVFGGIIAVIIGAIMTMPFFIFLEQNSNQIIILTPIVLIFALIIFITEEKNNNKKLIILFIIISAGGQGILFKNQIFPLISGYFGIAGLIYSLKEKEDIIKINQSEESTVEKENIIDALIGVIGGAIVSVLPGIGSNTAGGIINAMRKTTNPKNYLTMLGAINASNFFFSFAMLLALSKARNGTMIALADKIFYTQETLFIGTIIMLFAAGVGGLCTIIIAKKVTHLFNEKNTKQLNIFCLIFMIVLVGATNGLAGIIALIFSSALGFYTISQNIRRSTLMSSLIASTIFFYLFILL
jgi:putative membrane protein